MKWLFFVELKCYYCSSFRTAKNCSVFLKKRLCLLTLKIITKVFNPLTQISQVYSIVRNWAQRSYCKSIITYHWNLVTLAKKGVSHSMLQLRLKIWPLLASLSYCLDFIGEIFPFQSAFFFCNIYKEFSFCVEKYISNFYHLWIIWSS